MSNQQFDPQTIAVHSAGAKEFTRNLTVTELSGRNILSDTMTLSLGDEFAPSTWAAPDAGPFSNSISVSQWMKQGGRNPFKLAPTTLLYQLSGQLFVGTSLSPAIDSYWLWVKIGEGSAVIPRRAFKVIIT